MTAFTMIWIGQILSLLGTAMSHFGVTLWVFDAGGERATPMTLIGLAFFVPMVIFTPVVGVLVDRANRKVMMMLSDLAAAFTTLVILVLYTTGVLEIWHLYITAFIGGTFQGFQWPAYSAALSTMLDKKDYTRANAMLQMVGPASNVFAPMVAAALIGPLGAGVRRVMPAVADGLSGQPGLLGLLIIDLISAAFAVGTLLFVHIPQPTRSEEGERSRGNVLQEAIYGGRYILDRPGLLGLQGVFMLGNLFITLGHAIFAAMILARTGSDELILGSVQTAAALGGVIGGVILSAWGGFTRRVHGVLGGWILGGLTMAGMGFARSLTPWIVVSFVSALFPPLINASNQAIWQAKVPPDVQGRVFATRRLIAWAVSPISMALAGPLADDVFEPAMAQGGALAPLLGGMFGTGDGAGMGVQFALAGLLSAIVGIVGYRLSSVYHVEADLPDHDAVQADAADGPPPAGDA